MKFLQVVFLAFWQLTAIPFVGVFTAYALKPHETQSYATNMTVAYKTSVE